jgi:hypothetical protein
VRNWWILEKPRTPLCSPGRKTTALQSTTFLGDGGMPARPEGHSFWVSLSIVVMFSELVPLLAKRVESLSSGFRARKGGWGNLRLRGSPAKPNGRPSEQNSNNPVSTSSRTLKLEPCQRSRLNPIHSLLNLEWILSINRDDYQGVQEQSRRVYGAWNLGDWHQRPR